MNTGVPPIKYAWKKAVSKWRFENKSQKLKKEDLQHLLESIMDTTIKPDTIKTGFKTCGLATLDVNDIDLTRIVGNLAQKENQATQKKKLC